MKIVQNDKFDVTSEVFQLHKLLYGNHLRSLLPTAKTLGTDVRQDLHFIKLSNAITEGDTYYLSYKTKTWAESVNSVKFYIEYIVIYEDVIEYETSKQVKS